MGNIAITSHAWSETEQANFSRERKLPLEIFTLAPDKAMIVACFDPSCCEAFRWCRSDHPQENIRRGPGVIHIFTDIALEMLETACNLTAVIVPSEALDSGPGRTLKKELAVGSNSLRVKYSKLWDTLFSFISLQETTRVGSCQQVSHSPFYQYSVNEVLSSCVGVIKQEDAEAAREVFLSECPVFGNFPMRKIN